MGQGRVMKRRKKAARTTGSPSRPRRGARGKPSADRRCKMDWDCRLLLKNLPIAVWTADTDGRLIDANSQLAKMTGYSIKALKEKGIGAAFWDPPAGLQLLKDAQRPGGIRDFEALMKRKDGKLYWVLMNADPVEMGGRKVILGTWRHFSDEKFNRNMAAFQRRIIDTMQVGLVVVRRSNGVITYANPRIERMFGYGPEELAEKPGYILCAPQPGRSQQDVYKEYTDILERQGMWEGDMGAIRKDGSRFWTNTVVSGLVVPWEDEVWAWLFADITLRKKAERALQESERRFRDVLAASRDVIYRIDLPSCNYDYVSPSASRVTGFEVREILAMGNEGMARRVHPDDRQQATVDLERLLEGAADSEVPERAEFRWKCKDGQYRWFSDSRVVVRDESGTPLAVVGAVRDVTGRRRTLEALRESEQRYRLLFDLAPVGIGIADFEGNVLEANRHMQELTGYTQEDFKSVNIASTYNDPRDRQKLLDALRKSGKAHEFEVQLKRKDGTAYWALLNAEVVEFGGRQWIFTSHRDITQRKLGQQRLQDSEERYRRLFEESPISLWEADCSEVKGYLNELHASGVRDLGRYLDERPEVFGRCVRLIRVMDVNEATVKLVKAGSKEEALASLPRVFTKAAYSRVKEELICMDEGREIFESEGYLRTLEGDEICALVNMHLVYGPGEAECRALVGIRDISEQKRAEEALRKSEREYRTLFETVPVGVYRTTIDGRILLANPALVKMLGYDSFEQLSERNLEEEGFEPDYPRSWFKQVMEKEGSVRGLETVWLARDGSELQVRESAVAVRDAKGRILYYEGTVEDITEQKRAQEEVQKAQAKLVTAREEERRRLAAELHDSVSQGLIALQLSLQRAIGGAREKGNEEQAKEFDEIVKRCGSMAQEVRQIGQGLYPTTLGSLGLLPAVTELARICTDAGVELKVDCCKALRDGRMKGDVEISLFRIVQEAVNNALRHSRAKHVKLKMNYNHGSVVVSVTDDGVGFDAASPVRRGLGLSLMRERVEAVRGRITITSRKGRTKVEVRVPAKLRKSRRK